MVQLPTSTHRLCWDREAAGEWAPTPSMPLKTRVSAVLHGSQHSVGHARPERCGQDEGTRAVPASIPWLVQAGSAVCLQALSGEVFLKGH